jgi:hypothetical protein
MKKQIVHSHKCYEKQPPLSCASTTKWIHVGLYIEKIILERIAAQHYIALTQIQYFRQCWTAPEWNGSKCFAERKFLDPVSTTIECDAIVDANGKLWHYYLRPVNASTLNTIIVTSCLTLCECFGGNQSSLHFINLHFHVPSIICIAFSNLAHATNDCFWCLGVFLQSDSPTTNQLQHWIDIKLYIYCGALLHIC